MKLQLIDEKYPVWEVSEFDLPEIELTSIKTYDQQYESETTHLRQHCKPDSISHNAFCTVWNDHTKFLEKFIRKEMNDVEEVRQMWMNTLSNFRYPSFSQSGEFIKDEEDFDMAPHVDNRGVFGVLIINLKDNPLISGTHFTTMKWMGPTKKHTGVFMLNNWNTQHGINNPGPGSRLIAYQNLHIDAI